MILVGTRPGKHTKSYGKPPFSIGKSIINGNCPVRYVSLPEGIGGSSIAMFDSRKWFRAGDPLIDYPAW